MPLVEAVRLWLTFLIYNEDSRRPLVVLVAPALTSRLSTSKVILERENCRSGPMENRRRRSFALGQQGHCGVEAL